MAHLSLSLLGPFQVTLDGEPVTSFESNKVRALLAYLTVEADRPHHREVLLGLLWPDWPERSARANLRNALSKLRRTIGDHDAAQPFLLVTRETIQFNRASDYWLDVTAFTEGVAAGISRKPIDRQTLQALEEAVNLYRGDFLEGFSVKDSSAFDDWALLAREQLHRQALEALCYLAQQYEACGELEYAVGFARRQVALEPWQEGAHQQLMRLLALNGQRSVALAQYETCCRLLREELDVEPAPETTQLYQRIRDGEVGASGPSVAPLGEHVVPMPAFLDQERPRETERTIFVARERQLAQLNAYLARALAGKGQVVFVTGGPGRGKTALMEEFARQALATHPDLLVACGTCSAYLGAGDPYLPFREVMGILTADVEARWATGAITRDHAWRLWTALPLTVQTLVDCGPHLIDIFAPTLLSRLAAAAPNSAAWYQRLRALIERQRIRPEYLEQRHLFGQYTNVLCALANQHPLLLLLDDIQWADAASIGLLFHLGRRLAVEGHRILVVSAYRPEEVALDRDGAETLPPSGVAQDERHPLEKVLNEFKRHFGDVWVDLTQVDQTEGRRFVDVFLDSEANCLGEAFRTALFRHTQGHPLFTIELLRTMQERGELVRDADANGAWAAGPTLNWDTLPARVQAVIQERLGRLERTSRKMLTIASVEGERFTAQVIAHVQDIPEREVLQALTHRLGMRHRLVRELGETQVDHRFVSRYRFSHRLFQRYLYESLSPGERRLLHWEVAAALEKLYLGCTEEIAVELARHYAGNAEQERHYARMAGERAAEQYANDEAVGYLSRALDLTPEMDKATRFDLLLTREKVYDVQGNRDAQAGNLEALRALATALDDDVRRTKVALRTARYAEFKSDWPAAIAAAQMAIHLAQSTQDVRSEAMGYLWWGRALWRQGDHTAARSRLEQALALAHSAASRQEEADSLRNLGIVYYGQSDYDRAQEYWEQALPIYREIGDRRGEWATISNFGTVFADQGDYAEAGICWKHALRICREIGDRWGEAVELYSIGRSLIFRGDYAGARACWEQALPIYREIDDRLGEAGVLVEFGRVSGLQGDYAGANPHYERALRLYRETGDRSGEARALALLGLCSHHRGDGAAAQRSCQQAQLIAQDLGNRHLEGGALTILSHALVGLGHLAEAADAYRHALDLWREAGLHNLATEPLAGLAHIYLAQGDLAQALTNVEQVLSLLGTAPLGFSDDPFPVYLTCYRVLRASQDPRAQEILMTAFNLLQELASKIEDEGLRRSFLENVAAHRDLLAAWEEISTLTQ